jgi:hypothetical protein
MLYSKARSTLIITYVEVFSFHKEHPVVEEKPGGTVSVGSSNFFFMSRFPLRFQSDHKVKLLFIMKKSTTHKLDTKCFFNIPAYKESLKKHPDVRESVTFLRVRCKEPSTLRNKHEAGIY